MDEGVYNALSLLLCEVVAGLQSVGVNTIWLSDVLLDAVQEGLLSSMISCLTPKGQALRWSQLF